MSAIISVIYLLFMKLMTSLKKNIYLEKNVPVQEVSEAVDAALRHSGA